MSTPNGFPEAPGPFDEGFISDGSVHAQIELTDFMNSLHGYLDSAEEVDANTRDLALRLGPKRTQEMGLGLLIRDEVETVAVPAICREMEFLPKGTSEATLFLKRFFLRFVELTEIDGIDSDEPVRANDVLLDLEMVNGNDFRYAINADPEQPGATRYTDAEALDYRDDEIKQWLIKRPNIYRVVNDGDYWHIPHRDVQSLTRMVRESYPITHPIKSFETPTDEA